MSSTTTRLDINLYPPEAQGAGQFDGGRITETKLIFPGISGHEVKRHFATL